MILDTHSTFTKFGIIRKLSLRIYASFLFQVYNGSLEAPYTNPKAPVHIVTGSAVSFFPKHKNHN